MKLNQSARQTIKWSGATITDYVRHYSGSDGEWRGDSCGCVDDRCIGYHHDAADECGCLPAWIDDMLAAQRVDRIRADLAALRRTRSTPVLHTGLRDFSRDDLVQLRDAFAAAVDEHDALRARWAGLPSGPDPKTGVSGSGGEASGSPTVSA